MPIGYQYIGQYRYPQKGGKVRLLSDEEGGGIAYIVDCSTYNSLYTNAPIHYNTLWHNYLIIPYYNIFPAINVIMFDKNDTLLRAKFQIVTFPRN